MSKKIKTFLVVFSLLIISFSTTVNANSVIDEIKNESKEEAVQKIFNYIDTYKTRFDQQDWRSADVEFLLSINKSHLPYLIDAKGKLMSYRDQMFCLEYVMEFETPDIPLIKKSVSVYFKNNESYFDTAISVDDGPFVKGNPFPAIPVIFYKGVMSPSIFNLTKSTGKVFEYEGDLVEKFILTSPVTAIYPLRLSWLNHGYTTIFPGFENELLLMSRLAPYMEDIPVTVNIYTEPGSYKNKMIDCDFSVPLNRMLDRLNMMKRNALVTGETEAQMHILTLYDSYVKLDGFAISQDPMFSIPEDAARILGITENNETTVSE